MSGNEVTIMAHNAIVMMFYLSMPLIVAATAVGLIVALLQTLLQLQEQTLAFAAKLTVIVLMLSMSIGWMGFCILTFFLEVMDKVTRL